jgi:hypothetical protein
MTTTVENQFAINGVIDTSKTVVQNLQTLCAASGCWLSYDIAQGKWAVAINQAGSSVASFNDSNIIGGINISSTGLTELYNSVEIEFPHRDIKDRKDYITFSVASGDRYPNEPDNVLQLQTDVVNDPIQAAYIASRELKQSRVDKVIEFRTDFSKMGLKAGDLIDVTNAAYGYTNKVFRIVSLQEDDSDEGVLSLSIRALEYDADVYSTSGLERDDRFVDNGIITKDKNTATTASDGAAGSNNLTNALLGAGGAALLATLLNSFAKSGSAATGTRAYTGVGLQPVVYAFNTGILSATRFDTFPDTISLGYSTVLPYTGIYKCKYNINWGGSGSYPNGVFKNSTMVAKTNGIDVGFGAGNFTGDQYSPAYDDHFLEEVFIGYAGQPVDFYFTYATDWTTAIFLINGELSLIQRTA